MINSFFTILPEIRRNIYRNVLTPDLFQWMDTCRQIRQEGLIELKGRIKRLGIRCEESWGVLQCKQAYLWQFGTPEKIFESEIPESLCANLSSRGLIFVGRDGEFRGVSEHTFEDWRTSDDRTQLIPIDGLSDHVTASDVILFVHEGTDYLLVREKMWRLINLTNKDEIILGEAACCTVDAISHANYIFKYQFKSHGVGYVSWCELSQLIKGNVHWQECRITETPFNLKIDVIQNQIFILELFPGECLGTQRGVVNMESGQWTRFEQRTSHQPSGDSPIFRLRKQRHATSWDPITMKHVAIGGMPCYHWDVRKQGEYPAVELQFTVKEGWVSQPIRALYKFVPNEIEVDAIQSSHRGCWPILNVVFRVNDFIKCKTWRLVPPNQTYAELECDPISKAYAASDLDQDKWGENVIVRALRINAHWAFEPLMLYLRIQLIEQLQDEDTQPTMYLLGFHFASNSILRVASQSNRAKFVEFFFCRWLPALEKDVKSMSLMDDIDSFEINVIDNLMPHLLTACKLGHLEVALSLIKFSALNIPLSDWQEEFAEWPPFKGALCATYALHWNNVIPLIATQQCSERDRIRIYQFILGNHIFYPGHINSCPEGFKKLVLDLSKHEPAILETTEYIAAAVLIASRDLICRISPQAEVDLPPYNGNLEEWQGIAYRDSLIFRAILGLETQPEAMKWFIEWLVSRNLSDRVEEALELMKPQLHKRQRSKSPPM